MGTSAQFSSSQFLSNSTEYEGNSFTGEGGGIAAETDNDNDKQSLLNILNTTFTSNTNGFPGSGSAANDIAGIISYSYKSCGPALCEGITTNSQLLAPLSKTFLAT